jgi:hypothetical protein
MLANFRASANTKMTNLPSAPQSIKTMFDFNADPLTGGAFFSWLYLMAVI